MPLTSQFSQVFAWEKLGKMVPVREHRQCLLCFCNLPEGRLRVLDCIGSLHKTHSGITAHNWTEQVVLLRCWSEENKKKLHAITDRSCP